MSYEQMSLFTDEELGITPSNPQIIGLTGYAQSGKDTVAKILIEEHGYRRMAFADKIRDVLYDLNPTIETIELQTFVDKYGWDEVKVDFPEARAFLQKLGVAIREHVHIDAWVNAVLDDINPQDKVVITDVRFINEAYHIRGMGGTLWRVTRPGVTAVNNHVSEHELDKHKFDVINNDGTIDDLREQVRLRMNSALTK